MAERDLGFVKIKPAGNTRYVEFLLHRALMASARGADRYIRDKMSDTMGSGRKYANLPNPSSAPDEYPVRQSGATLDSLGLLVQGNTIRVGLVNATLGMYKLEFEPPSEGGRAPIRTAFEDEQMHQAMLAAVRRMHL